MTIEQLIAVDIWNTADQNKAIADDSYLKNCLIELLEDIDREEVRNQLRIIQKCRGNNS